MSMRNDDRFGYITELPRQSLSVTDIERLAKAGVKMEFKDIAAQVTPDFVPAPLPEPLAYPNELTRSFWERWRRANVRQPFFVDGMTYPYEVFAVEQGDKVYVFVAPGGEKPFILEDASPLFPSDALMASLALYNKVKP